ncbi:MAG: single-stranded DNA-binding protein [Methanobrevibacter sp.]|nr:single-stranded DNA-binding protein [Methanobrevibacter sp.]
MNNVNMIGRVASDVLKFPIAQFNKNVVKFAIAVDNRTRKTDGIKDTFFFDCEAWDIVADKIYEACKKGDRLGISGHLEQVKFTRKDGTAGSKVKIVVSGVEFLFPKREESQNTPECSNDDIIEEIDDELPF